MRIVTSMQRRSFCLLCIVAFAFVLSEDLTEDEDDDYIYYDNHNMVLLPQVDSMNQIDVLLGVREKFENFDDTGRTKQVTFFDDILIPEKPLFLVVAPDVQEEVYKTFDDNSIPYKILRKDLQNAFDMNWERGKSQRKRYKDTIAQDIYMAPFYFMPYKEMTEFMKFIIEDLNNRMGQVASTFSIGKSSEGRDIIGVAINDNRQDLPAIWIDGGLDGRNYLAQSMSIFLLWEIIQKNDEDSIFLRDNFRFYFIPNVNPDGYSYNMDQDRMWRKNTRGIEDQERPGCFGVNLMKNFDVNFGGPGTSDDPCSDLYRGAHPLSEPETQALAKALDDRKKGLQLYINFGSFGHSWNIPWSGRLMTKPDNYDYQWYLAKLGIDTMATITNTPPQFGTHPDLRYPMQGHVLDYVHEKLDVPYAYSVDLRPSMGEIPMETNYYDLPSTFIHVCGPEIFAALTRMAKEIVRGVELPPEGIHHAREEL